MSDVPIREAARSDDPALDALLKRALELHPSVMDLGLERMRRLLSDLGDPQDAEIEEGRRQPDRGLDRGEANNAAAGDVFQRQHVTFAPRRDDGGGVMRG